MTKYTKYSHLEHILARPDTYVGTVESDVSTQWVAHIEDDRLRMVEKRTTHVAALLKIFDEILVNAIDHSVDPNNKVDKISVIVNENEISIMNTCKGIPIQKQTGTDTWIPEMIFGELLTSSNYDDSEERITGGRNGYGAKLTNVFSSCFELDTANCEMKKRYVQTWTNNMTTKSAPKITKYSKTNGYTKITFKPDLEKFKLNSLKDDNIISMFEKRTYDTCACTPENVKVMYNDKVLQYKSFEKYIDLYIGLKKDTNRVFIKTSRWEVCIAPSTNGFKQVSFVNGINTSNGGSHVEYIVSNLVKKLIEYLTTKHKNIKVKPQHVKENVFVFVKSTLVNPTFSSQTKTECTSRYNTFGSRFDFDEDAMKKIVKLEFIQEIIALAKHNEMRELKKSDGKKTNTVRGIPKLEDANKAGTSQSSKCTLILTEGDSAKTFAISGLSVVGRDYYGVFPLKGKLLNVRDASAKQLMNNEEINNIKKIVGLQNDKTYSNLSELRYGKVMILTDADVDGSHIKGLFMNFIHYFWPSLMKYNGFITSLRTPIIKTSRGSTVHCFYNEYDYQKWKNSQGNLNAWKIKYYKGLGTSTANEAKSYFTNIDQNMIQYNHMKDDSIHLAFKKNMADDRKEWIKIGTMDKPTLDHTNNVITTCDFINKDMRWFSIADNERSIPSMIDGFKPSQRKVLYACRKRSSNDEIKVSQLSGLVSTETAYHHGEQSLMGTIVNMSQDFLGSNNINLLEPIGQFGTRLMGGKDSASPRYIFTKLSKNVTKLFHSDDDQILSYVEDDGLSVEPLYFVPVLPMILVNGAEGIGTGYSTSIPCFNPEDIKHNIVNHLNGKDLQPMKPWYKNFKGTITQENNYKFITKGIWNVQGDLLTIKELPVGKWTTDYKEFLESLLDANKIKKFENHSTEVDVNFKIKLLPTNTMDIEKDFKLTTSISTSNMHAFNQKGIITKYEKPTDIIKEFVNIRLKYYQLRKTHLLNTWTKNVNDLETKIKFMKLVMNDDIVVFRRNRENIKYQLLQHKFKEEIHDLLLNIKLHAFTEEKILELETKIKELYNQINVLQCTHINDIWKLDMK